MAEPGLLNVIRAALDATTDSVLITTAELESPGPQIVYVNAAFEKMTGYTADEVIGKTPRILQGPKTERAVLDRLRSDLAQGRPFYGNTINYRKDGSEFHLEWRIAPIKNEAGQTEYYVAVQRDVTEQRKEAEQLKQEVEQLREALEHRKLIERAKGVFMKETGLDEPDAYRRMQLIARQRNIKLVDLAQAILTATGLWATNKSDAARRPPP
jgi:PAS domain S-box-containing protein